MLELIVLLSFVLALCGTVVWMRIARKSGLVGKDMNKYDHPEIPEAGGVAVVFSLTVVLSLLPLLGFDPSLVFSLALLVLLAGFLGFIDDVLGWKKGLPRSIRVPLSLLPALPLSVYLYLHGYSLFGLDPLFTSFLLVPIGVMGAANAVNILAGFNGLEAGLTSLLFLFLGIKAYLLGNHLVALLSFTVLASLLAFLLFNWYPARVFSEDTFTYAVGSLYAALVVVSNLIPFGIALFTLYFIDALLRMPVGFKTETFGKPTKDGKLLPRDKVPRNLPQLILNLLGPLSERALVLFILFLQTLIGITLLVIS